MSYKFFLPNDRNEKVEYTTDDNSIVIIGANGSGKSKLGAWMEQNDLQNTHRIGAQRSLTFGSYIQQMSYEQATRKLIYGTERKVNDHNNRWKWDGEKYSYTSTLLDDYESVLSAIAAKKAKEESEYITSCRTREKEGLPHMPVPEMVIDILTKIWKSVFPQRNIKFDDGKVVAILVEEGKQINYKGRDMSDGERVALYLISQALCVPNNTTIIIDEPELHLHRSIMNRLWTSIEKVRQDCLFIYITHDTQFAANHRQAKKIWVKSYNGYLWEFGNVTTEELPEQLLLDIMGNRRQVLFVEGEADSYDTKLYSEIYSDYYVVACGSCSRVIQQTKAMKASPQLHDLNCFGIIDRDYRCEYEIEKLKESDIYTLKVAEVENLFIVEELLNVVNSILGYTDLTRVQYVKEYVIDERFANELNKQICAAVVSEIKYNLSTVDVSGDNDDYIKQNLHDFFDSFSYNEVKAQKELPFCEAATSKNYKKILALYNRKSLKNSVGHYFGLNNNDYCNFILRQLRSVKGGEIKQAIQKYLPIEIPI